MWLTKPRPASDVNRERRCVPDRDGSCPALEVSSRERAQDDPAGARAVRQGGAAYSRGRGWKAIEKAGSAASTLGPASATLGRKQPAGPHWRG